MSREGDPVIPAPNEAASAAPDALAPASARRPRLREGAIGLAIALVLCTGLRLGLSLRSGHTIAKDGVYYLQTAQALGEGDPLQVLRESYAHPVYPLAVRGAHGLLEGLSREPDSPERWARAGMLVSLVGALVATVGLWLFAGLAYDWRVAWITVLAFSASDNWVELGADALTDALGVGVQLGSAVLAVLVLRAMHQTPARRGLILAAGAGLVGGLGFLVRIEAVLLPVAGMIVWLIPRLRRPAPARRAWAAVGLCAAAMLALIVPYMVLVGQVTSKLHILRQVFPWLGRAVAGVPCLAAGPLANFWKALQKLSEAEGPVLMGLTIVCLLIWLLRRSPRPGQWHGPRRPSIDGVYVVGIYAVMLLPLVMVRGMMGGVSTRYMMVLGSFLACVAGSLLAAVGEFLARRVHPRSRPAARLALVAPVVLITAGLAAHALQPTGRSRYKAAAKCAAEHARPGDVLMADDKRVLFYSGLPGYDLQFNILLAVLHGDDTPKTLEYWIDESDATLVALTSDTLDGEFPQLPGARAETKSNRLRELGAFAEPGREDTDVVHVYRVTESTGGDRP